jgi:hypothetical protein
MSKALEADETLRNRVLLQSKTAYRSRFARFQGMMDFLMMSIAESGVEKMKVSREGSKWKTCFSDESEFSIQKELKGKLGRDFAGDSFIHCPFQSKRSYI